MFRHSSTAMILVDHSVISADSLFRTLLFEGVKWHTRASCLPQSMMTPSRIVLPWQAVEVIARACEIGKPVLVTVYSRKMKGSEVRGSMKTKF